MNDMYQVGLALIDAAGLQLPDDEAARLAGSYPALRERADRLYAVVDDDTAPELAFDPTLR